MAVTVALEELHTELGRNGHSSLRPVHGYALNAVLNGHHTASALAPLLAMTKQGAARVVQHLVDEGYLSHGTDADARRKALVLTERGHEVVRLSVQVQERIEGEWAELAGRREMAAVRRVLEAAVRHRAGTSEPPVRRGW